MERRKSAFEISHLICYYEIPGIYNELRLT